MNTENLSTLKMHKLTQAQYDRELGAGNIDANACVAKNVRLSKDIWIASMHTNRTPKLKYLIII